MGFGDRTKRTKSRQAMRKTMDQVEWTALSSSAKANATSPMLYIGEKVGLGQHAPKSVFPQWTCR